MIDLFLNPGAPFYLASLAGVCLAALGALQLERTRLVIEGVRSLPSRKGMTGRLMLGHLAGVPLATLCVLVAFASGTQGMLRLGLLISAFAIYMYAGWVLPRKVMVQAQKERRILRKLTPGFISFVRICRSTGENYRSILEHYALRPDARRAPMQLIVLEALELLKQHKESRPFAAFHRAAVARGCRELIDVAEALAQAEIEGDAGIDAALAAQEKTLTAILEDEFKRTIKRRAMYLLGMVAISLVCGILLNLLFVMSIGSGVMGGL